MQGPLQVRRQRRLEGQRATVRRVPEGEAMGVEELTPYQRRRLPVHGVADDGVADGGEVDADIGASGRWRATPRPA